MQAVPGSPARPPPLGTPTMRRTSTTSGGAEQLLVPASPNRSGFRARTLSTQSIDSIVSTSSTQQEESNTNLIINYLPSHVTREELMAMFAAKGPVKSCRLIYDKISGVSLGYGFVDYVNVEDAAEAIKAFHGLPIGSKLLKVALARPSSVQIVRANLFVRGLTPAVDEQRLAAMFSAYGTIISTRILRNVDGTSRGVGFVRFDQRAAADAAIAAKNETELDGGILLVKYADEGSASMVQPTANPAGRSLMRSGDSASSLRYGSTSSLASLESYDRMSISSQQRWGAHQSDGFLLQVNNLPAEYGEAGLTRLCAPFGPTLNVQISRNASVPGLAYGLVSFGSHVNAMVAQAHLHGHVLGTKVLDVRLRPAVTTGLN